LAKSVWFQFADRALQLEEMFWAAEPRAAEALSQETMLAYRGHTVLRDYNPEFRPTPDVRDMREALKGRAVTNASDEALCVFANMHLDMELVTGLPHEERMPMFWKTVKKVPIGVVFNSTNRKLTLPGLHWAPQSFMGDLDTPHWLIEQEPKKNGYYTPEGLMMNICGYHLSPRLLVWDDSFDTIFTNAQCRLRDEDGVWYWTELLKPWNPDRSDFPGAGEHLAIIMISPLKGTVIAGGDDPFNFSPGKQSIIGVYMGHDEDDVAHFKGYRHMLFHMESPAFQSLFDSVYKTVERYVEETCQQQLLNRLSLNEEPENDGQEPETPATFTLTDERRVEVQRYAEDFAKTDPVARKLVLALGKVHHRKEDAAIEQYGFHGRFQLQMRLRNNIRSFPATTPWCID
jgi:hypothetical protein